MNGRDPHSRVVVIGMDGLDPRHVATMIQAGRLPAFARLRSQGTVCPLATSNPAESPVAWSTLATGCDPGSHGIFDFIHRDPRTYLPYLSTQRESGRLTSLRNANSFVTARKKEGFWRYASDAGIPTTVVRWPISFPAEQVNGNFLAGLGVPDVLGRLGKHAFYTTLPVDESQERHTQVTWKHTQIDTCLYGPEGFGLRGRAPLRTQLHIQRKGEGISLAVGECRLDLRTGEWSDWCTVKFKWGPVTVCEAILKFHLVSVNPEFRLFVTPLQIHPANQPWPLTQPPEYGAEIVDQLGLFYTLGLPEDTHAVTDGCYDLDAFFMQCAEISRERRAMFDFELNRFQEGLLAFVFDTSDRLQHMFWSIADEASPTYDADRARKYADVIDDMYVEMDDVLARTLDVVQDDAAVFVVSDHGFGPYRRTVHLNRWLIDNGYMYLKNATVGESLLASVDWDRTQAYALGFSSIYLNQAGRESKGIVDPGKRSDVLTEISDRLANANDPVGSHRMIRQVYLSEQIYAGDHASDGPDLVVGFEPGYRASWQTALGAAPEMIVEDNNSLWSADHLVDPSAVPGVLASNLKVTAENPEGLDLAPTVLHCLGVPIPRHMQGRPWVTTNDRSPTSPQESGKPVPRTLPREPVAGCVGGDAGPDMVSDETRAAVEKRLRDLGYL